MGAHAANGEPDEERDHRHSAGLDQIDIPSPGRQRQRFCQIADKADTIIGHRRDRQPFHRLLQAQLLAGTGVHRLQQVAVLPLDDHLRLGLQQVAGAGDPLGQARQPLGKGPAAVQRRCHAPPEEPANPLKPCKPRELQAGDAVHQNGFIGLGRRQPVGCLRVDFLKVGGLRRKYRQQLLDLAMRLPDLCRKVGCQAADGALDPAKGGAMLAHRRKAEERQHAIGLELDDTLDHAAHPV